MQDTKRRIVLAVLLVGLALVLLAGAVLLLHRGDAPETDDEPEAAETAEPEAPTDDAPAADVPGVTELRFEKQSARTGSPPVIQDPEAFPRPSPKTSISQKEAATNKAAIPSNRTPCLFPKALLRSIWIRTPCFFVFISTIESPGIRFCSLSPGHPVL